jgi:GNAT superfamily N-acetyltransferase
VAAVARLAREIWREHYPAIIGRAQVAYMVPRFQGVAAIRRQLAEGTEYFLLYRGRRAEGYFAIGRDRRRGGLFLSKLYVRKAARGFGLAKAALRHAESLCRRRRLGRLWLTVNRRNAASIAWYGRMGFAKAGRVFQRIGGGFAMDDYRMEKRVPRAPGARPTRPRSTRGGRGRPRRGG